MEDELTLPLPPPKKKTPQPTEDVLLLPPPPPKKAVDKKEESFWEGLKKDNSVFGVIGGAIEGLGKSAWNVITNQIPQEFKTEDLRNSKGTIASYINPSKRDGDANIQSSGFEFPEADDLRSQYSHWVFKQPDSVRQLDNEKRSEIFLKEKLGDKGYDQLTNKFNTQLSKYRSGLETEVGQQKKESEDLLMNIPQTITDVNTPEKFGEYVGQLGGQGLGRIATSVATGGAGSLIAERSAVYDRQLDQMAQMVSQQSGIPTKEARQNIVKLQKDNPEAGRTIADFAALLDIASIPTLGSGKVIGKVLPPVIEGATEAIQSELEEKGATQGSGADYQYDPVRTIDSFLGGAVGGELAQSLIPTKTKVKLAEQVIDKTADTGNPAINAQIDEGAKLSPEEEQQLKQKQDEQKAEQPRKESSKNRTEGESNQGESGTQKEITNAIQEPSPSSEIPLPGEGGENIAQSSEGIRSGIEGQETTEKSKAYQEALDKVTALQDKFTKLPIDQNADELMFDLREARRSLAAIAGSEKPNVKTKLQKQIDNSINPKQEPVTVGNPAAALKQQIKQHYQHIKEGVVKGASAVNDLIQKVKDTAKEHKLTNAQTTSLLGKVQNSNLFTPGSVSKLNSFIEKVADNADYAEKLQKAKELRKAVTKKGKSTVRDFRERDLSSIFRRINPEEVDNIDEYNTIAESLKEGFKPNQVVNLEEAHKSLKDMVTKMYRNEFKVSPAEAHTAPDMLDQLELRKDENKTNDRIEQLANELGVDFDQAAAMYNEEEKGGNPKQLRDNLLTIAKSLKVDTSEPFVGIKKNITDLINKIDPDLLSVAQLKKFIAVVDRINENNSFSEAGSVYAMALAQEGWRNIKSAKAKFKILNLNYLESKIDSLPLAIKAIFGLSEVASAFQLHSGMMDVSNVKDYASKAKNDLTQKLNELHHKQKERGFTDESVFRQAIYGNLIAYPEQMNSEEALTVNKGIIDEMIQTYADAGLSKDATVVSNLYKPFKDAKTIEEVQAIMKKIDPDGQRALHAIIDFFTNHKISEQDNRTILEALTDDNELFHNEDTENIVNYSGSRKWRPVGVLNSKEVDVEDLDRYDSNNPAKPRRLSSGYSRAMRYQKGKVLDLNAHLNATNQVEHNVYDIVSKPYRLQVREFAHDKAALMELFGSPEFEGETDRENLDKKESKNLDKLETNKKRAVHIINTIFEGKNSLYHSFERTAMGQNAVTHNQTEKVILGTMSAVKALGYGMTLSGFTQVVKQATVLINTGIQTGLRGGVIKSIVEIASNPTEASKFFSGTTVNFRGESHALLNAGDSVDRTALHNIKNKLKGQIPNYLQSRFDGKIGWFSGITPLIFSDVRSAKSSFLAFYQQYLNTHADGYQGLEEENKRYSEPARREAKAYAKQQVDTLQGVSNPAEQGEWFKDPRLVSNVARSLLVPYGHFASNSKARLYADYTALVNGNSNQKVEAGKDILATTAESVGFAVTAQATRAAMLLGIGTLLSKLIGFPPKEDWDEWWEKAKKAAAKEMLFSNLPVILTTMGENVSVDFINWAYYGLMNFDDEGISQKQYEREYAPLTRIDTSNNKWFDYLGPYGAGASGVARLFELQDNYRKADEKNLTDDQTKLALTAAIAQWGQIVGVLPADVSNAVKSTFYNEMKRSKATPQGRSFERRR